MIAVGDRLVATAWSVDMVRIVAAATVRRRASIGIGLRDGDDVFIDMAIMGVVQMSIMEVVDVSIMHDGLMTTVGAVHMVVCFMNFAIRHGAVPFEPHLRRSSST